MHEARVGDAEAVRAGQRAGQIAGELGELGVHAGELLAPILRHLFPIDEPVDELVVVHVDGKIIVRHGDRHAKPRAAESPDRHESPRPVPPARSEWETDFLPGIRRRT